MKSSEKIKILVDTSVLLDFFVDNEPYSDYSKKILFLCHRGEIDGLVTASSLVQLFYLLENELSVAERREMLRLLLKIFTVSGIDKQKIFDALSDSDSRDLLQNMQIRAAMSANVDYVVTGNLESYHNTEVRVITSMQFVKLFESAATGEKFTHGAFSRADGGSSQNLANKNPDDWRARFRASAYGI